MRRIIALAILSIAWTVGAVAETKQTIVIVHGAWAGAWQFARIEPFLREAGYDVRRVTLTGLGERSHLVHSDIGLETHLEDVLNVIRFENLNDIVLLGHSYGGMVITGVADRMPERVRRLIYLDAMIPESGESAADIMGPNAQKLLANTQDGLVPAWWVKPGKPYPIDVPHPAKTFTDKLVLTRDVATEIAATYILTVEDGKAAADDDFIPFAQRAEKHGWPVIQMSGDHNPHWRQPKETAAVILDAIAR